MFLSYFFSSLHMGEGFISVQLCAPRVHKCHCTDSTDLTWSQYTTKVQTVKKGIRIAV